MSQTLLNILNILLQVYLATVVVGIIVLLWVLVVELREGKVRLVDTFKNFFICVLLMLIPILNLSVTKQAFKQI